MEDLSLLQQIAIFTIPVLFAIALHEVAHGWIASLRGDLTAKMLGRLSLNPIKHIDPIGTVALPLVSLLISGMLFGWAKPVPVNWNNLKNPKMDMALVALAGPMANLLMAVLWVFILKLGYLMQLTIPSVAPWLILTARSGVEINCAFCVLNLLPIPPLDGGRILVALTPPKISQAISRVEPFGFLILIFLLVSGLLFNILFPAINYLIGIIMLLPVIL